MKRSFTLLIITFLSAASAADAQKWRLNLSGGIDASKMAVSGSTGQQISGKTGIGGGLDLEMNCSPTLSVQLGAHFSQQGFSLVPVDPNNIASVNLNVLTIPLLLRLKATPNLHLLAGPQFGYIVSANTRPNSEEPVSAKGILKDFDYYAVFGAGYRFNTNIFAEARYQYGLSNVAEAGAGPHFTNRYFSFRVGYSFPLGGAQKK